MQDTSAPQQAPRGARPEDATAERVLEQAGPLHTVCEPGLIAAFCVPPLGRRALPPRDAAFCAFQLAGQRQKIDALDRIEGSMSKAWRVFLPFLGWLLLTLPAFAADDLAPLRALSGGEPLRLRSLLLAPAAAPKKATVAATPFVAALADGTCPVGYTQCTDGCVDLTASTTDCGGCGHKCATGESCVSGTCSSCPVGDTLCGSNPGSCVDTATDPDHCGGCGTACAAGADCISGTCACPSGQIKCSNTCTDVASDPSNCGGCGHVCALGESCISGACSSCPVGDMLCGSNPGVCANTSSNHDNCGACGIKCSPTQSCTAGICQSCPANENSCGNVCTSLASDSNNCGSCGNVCGSGASCISGICTCPGGEVSCGGNCVDPVSDSANCGSCGTVCAPVNACTSGICSYDRVFACGFD